MQPIKNCFFTKVFFAFILTSLLFSTSCGSGKYKYLSLNPLESGSRKAYEDYESVKNDDVEIRIARRLPDDVLDNLKKEEGKARYYEMKNIFKGIKKSGYSLFSLKVINEQNKKVILNPQKLTLRFLGKLLEKDFNAINEKDFLNLPKIKDAEASNLNIYFLAKSEPLEIQGSREILLVFPYKIKDEHMTKITLADVLIDERPYDFEYFFYSADKYARAKRIAQYTGMVTGGIILIVGGLAMLGN